MKRRIKDTNRTSSSKQDRNASTTKGWAKITNRRALKLVHARDFWKSMNNSVTHNNQATWLQEIKTEDNGRVQQRYPYCGNMWYEHQHEGMIQNEHA